MTTPPIVPKHLQWLVDSGLSLTTADGRSVKVFDLQHTNDVEILSAWAHHFREQYCSDQQIDQLRDGTGKTRAQYLRDIKFPDQTAKPGPSIRSGDFGEILAADYLEFVVKCWLPRTRYNDKTTRNESTKGTDIIGFLLLDESQDSPGDTLYLFEAKAQLTGAKSSNRLQAAVDNSASDELRKAESLNAIKQRFVNSGEEQAIATIQRFQNPVDRPHVEQFGAVAIVLSDLYSDAEIQSVTTARHPASTTISLIVIRGKDLMNLVHELYQRAADEA